MFIFHEISLLIKSLFCCSREKSSSVVHEQQRLSHRQAEILGTLNKLAADVSSFKYSLVHVVDENPSKLDHRRQAIAESIWSSEGISSRLQLSTIGAHLASDEVGNWNGAQDTALQASNQTDRYASRLLNRQETESEFYVKAIVDSLRFQGVKHREDAIPEAYTRTFQWVFERPPQSSPRGPWTELPRWLEQSVDDVYWITGKAGAGKSTMMKFLTTHPKTIEHLRKWSCGQQLILASFYFWNAGSSELQKSQTGLLRTLLLQCIEQMPSLAPKICPRRWAWFKIFGATDVNQVPQWSWGELVECFSALLLLSAKNNRFKLALFIDGLDEFTGDHQKLIDFVKLFYRRRGTKVIISSRPWNMFKDAFSATPSLRMEEFTSRDVEAFVNGEFNQTQGFHELRQAYPVEANRLTQGIVDKAQGVFLWVSVVVRALCEGLTEGDNLGELQALLNMLPTDLSQLYQRIWRSIKPQYIAQTAKLFQIRINAKTLLDVTTLHLADMEWEEALGYQMAEITGEKRDHIIRTMSRRLDSRTRGLLEVTKDGQVDYLHRSVRDWTETSWQDICAEADPDFDPHLALLQAFSVQVANPKIWENSSLHLPVEAFWSRTSMCLFHAASVRDEPGRVDALVKIMDRLDRELGALSTSFVDGSGYTLYRDRTNASLVADSAADLPHWSNTQYTMSPGQPVCTFAGLAAKWAILPYVRAAIATTKKPKLSDPQQLPVLSCAVLGFDHFARPDVLDIVERYCPLIDPAIRLEVVRIILDTRDVADKWTKKKRKKSSSGHENDDVRDLLGEVVQKRDFFRSISNADAKVRTYWEDVAELLGEYVARQDVMQAQQPSRGKKTRPSFPLLFQSFARLARKA